jgi:hypothetical protein
MDEKLQNEMAHTQWANNITPEDEFQQRNSILFSFSFPENLCKSRGSWKRIQSLQETRVFCGCVQELESRRRCVQAMVAMALEQDLLRAQHTGHQQPPLPGAS